MITLYFLTLSTASAWEVKLNSMGEENKWFTAPVKFMINPEGKHGLDPSEAESAIQKAAEEWDCTKYGGYLYYDYSGTSKITAATHDDGEQVVSFADTWTDDPDLLALTYVWSAEGGEIIHFDMRINSHHYNWTTDGAGETHDLQNAMTHEFGHALGLSHSEELESSMAATAFPGEITKRDLHQDDIEGFTYIYGGEAPVGADENPPLLGCSGIPLANSGSTDDGSGQSSSGFSGSGGGPNTPSSTGGAFVPINNSGCSHTRRSNGLLTLALLPLLGLLRRQQ